MAISESDKGLIEDYCNKIIKSKLEVEEIVDYDARETMKSPVMVKSKNINGKKSPKLDKIGISQVTLSKIINIFIHSLVL